MTISKNLASAFIQSYICVIIHLQTRSFFMKRLFYTATIALMMAANAHAADWKLTSTDIAEGKKLENAQVFNGFGCTGGNISPALSWGKAPEGTKSLAITAYDPDAPTGSGWWHWVAFNIPANTTEIATGASGKSMPAGSIESITDFGSTGFGGACPPQGDKPHHYHFTVWALKVDKLDLDANASGAKVGYFLHQNVLAKTSIHAVYNR
jgi:Raf kinase inhibitor-like YbhB/YbcL family protein